MKFFSSLALFIVALFWILLIGPCFYGAACELDVFYGAIWLAVITVILIVVRGFYFLRDDSRKN